MNEITFQFRCDCRCILVSLLDRQVNLHNSFGMWLDKDNPVKHVGKNIWHIFHDLISDLRRGTSTYTNTKGYCTNSRFAHFPLIPSACWDTDWSNEITQAIILSPFGDPLATEAGLSNQTEDVNLFIQRGCFLLAVPVLVCKSSPLWTVDYKAMLLKMGSHIKEFSWLTPSIYCSAYLDLKQRVSLSIHSVSLFY